MSGLLSLLLQQQRQGLFILLFSLQYRVSQ